LILNTGAARNCGLSGELICASFIIAERDDGPDEISLGMRGGIGLVRGIPLIRRRAEGNMKNRISLFVGLIASLALLISVLHQPL
jgi:hypothetical protein